MAITDNMISYWKLDESGTANAIDSLGANTLVSAASATRGTGLIGNGASFDGTTAAQGFQCAAPVGIGFSHSNDRTFTFWIKTKASYTGSRLFGMWSSNSSGSAAAKNFLCAIDQGATNAIIFFLGDGGGTTLGNATGATSVGDGNWHFVVITYSSADNKARIYIDGNSTPDATSSAFATVGATSTYFDIGAADNNAVAGCFMDEFGIWSRLLSTAEMSQLFNSGTGVQYPFSTTVISVDSFDAAMSTTAGTTLTFSHTCTGTNLILLVGAETGGAGDTVTGITYNSVAMTRIGTATSSVTDTGYLYYLLNPSTGTHNVVITATAGAVNGIRGISASYAGVKQSGQPDANSTNTGTGTTETGTVTVVAANSWQVMITWNDSAEPTAGTGTMRRGTSSGGGFGFFDSNSSLAPGSRSLVASTGGSGHWGLVSASFAPAVASTGNYNFFTFF